MTGMLLLKLKACSFAQHGLLGVLLLVLPVLVAVLLVGLLSAASTEDGCWLSSRSAVSK